MSVIVKIFKNAPGNDGGTLVGRGDVEQATANHLLVQSLNPVMTAGYGTVVVYMTASTIVLKLNDWHPELLGEVEGVPSEGPYFYELTDGSTGNSATPITGTTYMDQLITTVATFAAAWADVQPEVYPPDAYDEIFEVLNQIEQLARS